MPILLGRADAAGNTALLWVHGRGRRGCAGGDLLPRSDGPIRAQAARCGRSVGCLPISRKHAVSHGRLLGLGSHGGAVFIAWADLEDLYETGKTPIPDAHAALRQAAIDWLARPSVPNMAAYIEKWIAEADQIATAFVERDGGFWTSPS